MKLPRRVAPRSYVQLCKLSEARLLAYRRKALSLENSLEDSDYADRKEPLDDAYIWFKSDPRWQPLYDQILAALAHVQASK
jgi:hypothetical protein